VTTWSSLGLWEDEEKQIHQCLKSALKRLIKQKIVTPMDTENSITERLYNPHIEETSKKYIPGWTTHAQATSYSPLIHPDLRFSRRDTKQNQYNYDVECKLLRVKKTTSETDYCYQYVVEGIQRYKSGYYARNLPVMGTMLGYIQNGDIQSHIDVVNDKATYQGITTIQLSNKVVKAGVTFLSHSLSRDTNGFTLFHLWADFR
jgi:hypothetical protein